MLIPMVHRSYCGWGEVARSHSSGGRGGSWTCSRSSNSGVGKCQWSSHSSTLTSGERSPTASAIASALVIVAIHGPEALCGETANNQKLLQNVLHILSHVHCITLLEQ